MKADQNGRDTKYGCVQLGRNEIKLGRLGVIKLGITYVRKNYIKSIRLKESVKHMEKLQIKENSKYILRLGAKTDFR